MIKLEQSERLSKIEARWQLPIEKIFYNWHWKDNLTHKEIAKKIGVPRPTATRWFKKFGVASQDSHRITNQNLLNVGPRKGPRAKPKVKKVRPVFVNTNFFTYWTDEMAYMLGYFAADGSMYRNPRGAYFIDFVSIDKELISNAKRMFSSKHTIAELMPPATRPNNKKRYRLQIGSKEMFQDLLHIGLTPKKSKIIKLPKVPKKYFAHFVRGNFDGDGCVKFAFYIKKGRKKFNPVLVTQFSSGSKKFLVALLQKLKQYASVQGGCISMKHDKKGESYVLQMSKNDSFRLYDFMYRGTHGGDFLKRKWDIFQKAAEYYKSKGA